MPVHANAVRAGILLGKELKINRHMLERVACMSTVSLSREITLSMPHCK